MTRDFKRMTRIELESELSAERAARRSHTVIVMLAVLTVLGFMMIVLFMLIVLGVVGTVAPAAG